LFEIIKGPFLTAVIIWAAGMRDTLDFTTTEFGGTDIYFRALVLLSSGKHQSPDDDVPRIELLDSDPVDQAVLGRVGAAQIGLLRRLVHCYGFDGLQSRIERVFEDNELRVPQAESADEVARLLRLVAPIERDHDCALLSFKSPTGQYVTSRFYGLTQTVREAYMSVDN
jgi:hypothetical protein